MGLFLRKKARKPKRARKARGSTASPRVWDGRRALFGLRVLLSVLTVVAAVFGWQWSERALADYVSTHRNATVTVESVTLASAPSWMSPMLHDELQSLVAKEVGDDPLSGFDLRRAGSALAADPWVARVGRIQRIPGGQLVVHADYRQPVALVQVGDGYHLVDSQGVRLPGLYLEHQLDRLNMPVLTGVDAAAPAAGQEWRGADLHGGLALVRLLAPEPYMNQIRAIDLGQRDSRGRARLVLWTRSGGMVRWGLPPGREQSIEPDAATKKQRLAELYRRRRQIDAGGRAVDIFGASVFIHQDFPIIGDQAAKIG